LSLTFGDEGLGLPGFGFPWRDRRIQAPDLIVRLAPPQVASGHNATLGGRRRRSAMSRRSLLLPIQL